MNITQITLLAIIAAFAGFELSARNYGIALFASLAFLLVVTDIITLAIKRKG